VIEAGHKQLLSKQTIIVKRLVSDAAKGDPRAREQLGDIERTQPPQPANDPVGAAKDVEILARFKMELLRKLKNEDKGDSHD
jgi:hypothetical protein